MRNLLTLLLIALIAGAAYGQRRETLPMPKILTIGEGTVWRTSDNKDATGYFLPPWKEVHVTNVFGFNRPPGIGKKVTVVPIDVNASLIDLAIRTTHRGKYCDPTGADRWDIDLESVKQKEYFEITKAERLGESPFDVVIIYPAVKFARQLRANELKKNMLPPGTAPNTIKAAIDLTNDGIPDALITKYCCLQPAKAADECDLTCGKTFLKVRNRWRLVDTSSPC